MAVKTPNECWLDAHCRRWIGEDSLLEAVTDALEQDPQLVPEKFGSDERKLAKYARSSVLAKRPKTRGKQSCLILARESTLRYTASIASIRETDIMIGFKAKGAKRDWKPAFDLGDELATRLSPLVLAITVAIEPRKPSTKDAEVIDLIVESSRARGANLRGQGVIGLAPRTYFGSELVDIIGKKLIESLSLPVHWFPGGGARIDLVPEPWNATPEELVKPWQAAMRILRASNVFSEIVDITPAGTVIARRGKKWA